MSSDAANAVEKPQSPEPTAADLRKRLRAKMAAVLQAHKGMREAEAGSLAAQSSAKKAHDLFKALVLPATEDEQAVRDHLALSNERYNVYLDANAAADQAAAAHTESKLAWEAAVLEQYASVEQAHVCEALANDESALAARYMADRLSVTRTRIQKKPESPLPPPSPPLADLNDEQKSLLVKLADATFAAARVSARGAKVAPSVVAAVAAVDTTETPSVKSPVRPTEEEVQRYLRQSEDATTNRLRAHQTVAAILPIRAAVLAELAETQGILGQLLKDTDIIPDKNRRRESGSLLATARAVNARWTPVAKAFGEGCDESRLDKLQKPGPSKREDRQLKELRELMRTFAYAKARLNEASTTLKAQPGRASAFHPKTPMVEAKTWQECMAWHAAKEKGVLENEQTNKSRETKTQLLRELVSQYEDELKDAGKALYRYIVAIKPPGDRPPCDELRILMNAGSWMCTKNVVSEDKREGDYPIY